MNLTWVDWAIVFAMMGIMFGGVFIAQRYMKSVADFLSAGRSAGRYLVCVAEGIAMLGAITVVANFEMNFQAGFAQTWWGLTTAIVVLIVTVSGWVIYRFRETRALTLAQFFEMRYDRSFRIFTGIVAFVAGIINFGIFPAVGARFFIYFCGLPQTFSFLGMDMSTYAAMMILLLAISIYFVFAGGQIAVIITDYIQGLFVSVIFVVVLILFLATFSFDQIYEAMLTAEENKSLINPFKTSQVEDFNFWYFFIGIVGIFYGKMSWQGTQAYNSSAINAHEAKMGQVLTNWRDIPQKLFLLVVPICAYTVINNADFLTQAEHVKGVLSTIENEAIKSQLMVPLVLTKLLPVGIMGAFAAVMLAAFVSTHDTYLHSWASIFIQDVLLPIRQKPLSPEQHIRILRMAIFGVAVFIFFFSLYFEQSEEILLFFAITGAIFAGGSGAVIIGGLYWKKGTTAAAYTAMITGATISVGGILMDQFKIDIIPEWIPHNGQWMWFYGMVFSSLSYVIVSLLNKSEDFNMDKLLHRGKYNIEGEHVIVEKEPVKGWKLLGIGKEFTKTDKLIYVATYALIFLMAGVFATLTIISLTSGISDLSWMKFWYYYIYFNLIISVVVTVWFGLGGYFDIRKMLRTLNTMVRDHSDDGSVRH